MAGFREKLQRWRGDRKGDGQARPNAAPVTSSARGSNDIQQERSADSLASLVDDQESPATQSLWDRAYDALAKKEPELVKDYEKLLAKEEQMANSVPYDEPPTQPIPPRVTCGPDGPSRQAQLNTVIKQGLRRMEETKATYNIAGHEFVLTDQVTQAAKLLLWAKDWIGGAVQASPQASVAWAGVCLILPLLTNPTTAVEANRDGFTNVTARMRYYVALEPLLRQLGQNDGVPDTLMSEANNHIVDLYQHILEFQLCTVLRFYQSRLGTYVHDMFSSKDWKQTALDIKTREETVDKVLRQIGGNDNEATYEWYKDRVEDRVQGTCQWFLQHDHFQRWLAQESGPLLVSADPGCGKSVLAKHLIDRELFRDLLDAFPRIRIPGEEESETISQEVNCVIHHRVELLAKKQRLPDEIKSTLEEKLLEIDHRTYLWVYLVFDYLDTGFKKTPEGVEAAIQTMPKSLLVASCFGLNNVVELLLDKGADVEVKDNCGMSPLSFAAEGGHEAVTRLLLEKGADVEAKDNYDGWTPLLLAAKQGHEAVARLLLENGANVDAKDEDGQTPLSFAAEEGHEAVARLLLENGADVEVINNHGMSPLLYTAEEGHEALARLLLENGADVEVKNNYGMSPLSFAAEGGHEAVTRLLLEKGADVEAKDNDDGWTPLLLAAKQGHEAVARLLLENGANVDAKDEHGLTPLSLASYGEHEAVARLLIENGACIEVEDTS
ncbi:hypothetical protein SBRCBS47491_000916 [Sporothrix bragantina]|uniref:NWD NACHT-NTPase N-terminal domain-containing protein n=1 Tax=Sporothrix bragantina TaxID=671064 RepID=A0ABP0AUE0_9PEZI